MHPSRESPRVHYVVTKSAWPDVQQLRIMGGRPTIVAEFDSDLEFQSDQVIHLEAGSVRARVRHIEPQPTHEPGDRLICVEILR